MFNLFLCLIFISLLSSCAKSPKKVIFDRNSQIDAELVLDEYASSAERIHAKDLARRFQEDSRQEVVAYTPVQSRLASAEVVALFESKCSDIPVPIGCVPLKDYFNPESLQSHEVVLGYSSDISCDDLVRFYQDQMPAFGWDQRSIFLGPERLLIFEKYNQLCVVIVRSHEGWFYERANSQLLLCVSDNIASTRISNVPNGTIIN